MVDESQRRIVTLRDVLFIIFKRLKLIIFIFLVTMGTVIVGIIMAKPVYQASAKVILNRETSEAIIRMAPGNPLPRSFDLEEEINTEIELIRSRPVIEGAVDDIDRKIASGEIPSPEPSPKKSGADEADTPDEEQVRLNRVAAIQRVIEAEPVKKSDVIMILYRHTNPRMAMEITNSVADEYINYRTKVFRVTGAVDFFEEQIQISKKNLEELETAMKDFQEREAIISYIEQSTILLNQLNEFEIALTKLRKDIINKESKLIKMREFMSSPLQPLVPSMEIRHERVIAELNQQIIGLRMRRNELLTKYTEKNRMVEHLQREIILGEAELRKEVERIIELEESSLETLRAEEDALLATVEMLNHEVKTYPEKALTQEQLKRAIENQKQVYHMLMLKRAEAKISDASDRRIAQVSMLSLATVPRRPIKPQKRMLVLVGCLIGLLGGFGLAFVLEYLDHSLKTSEDVVHYIGLPVLAVIPEQK